MGIMTRILRLCKADVHGVMDQLEDKGLLLKQHIREMEASLDHKEQLLRRLTHRIDRLTGQIARQVEEMKKLEQELTLALEKERDDMARLLIRRRRALEAASGHLKEQMERMTQETTQLSETLAHQRLEYETLRAKADTYCRHAGGRLFETVSHHSAGPYFSVDPIDEEIELELLQRKKALQKGAPS